MPIYYFHLCNDVVVFDHVGVDLANDQAAGAHAEEYLRIAKKAISGSHVEPLSVRVTNENGKPLFRTGSGSAPRWPQREQRMHGPGQRTGT